MEELEHDGLSYGKECFLEMRTAEIRALKNPTEQQRIFADLAERFLKNPDDLSATELRGFKTLEKAERAELKAAAAKRAARKIIEAENERARKARTHEMIKSAGLLVQAGLVDGKTGKPRTSSAEILLGALIELAEREPNDLEKKRWAEIGAARLNAKN